jgi:cephalosporin hydroxylase
MTRDNLGLAWRIGQLILPRSLPAKLTKIAFHQLYYNDKATWKNTRWLGTPILKCPLDMWIYQDILNETKPDLIIETGTYNGGSALYLATLFDLLGRGRIITVDINDMPNRPVHPRIKYIQASSTDPQVTATLAKEAATCERVMVILDSDHSEPHVSKELAIFNKFVTRGCYMIVEDTNVNGHPVAWRHGPGPMEAVNAFLKSTREFEVDTNRERFLLSFNPRGYLLKV